MASIVLDWWMERAMNGVHDGLDPATASPAASLSAHRRTSIRSVSATTRLGLHIALLI